MKKTYADVQTVRQGVTTLINIDEKAHCEGVIRRHEGCQCDICRDKTRDVLPLTNESNATLSQPDAETRQHEPPEKVTRVLIARVQAGGVSIR